MTDDPIRWGVLSTARIAWRSVGPGIRRARNGVLRAVASRSLERAREFAAELEIPRAYGSYDELLADPKIDAVYVPLPTSLHHRWVIAAARAGKHVLVDKPFAADAAEAVEMVDACRAAGVQLLEGFMYRYDPRHARLRELVAEGAIGDVRQINTAFCFPITRDLANVRLSTELAGGALGDLGTYCVSVSRLHMGGEPRRLVARMTDDAEFGVDFDGNALLEFDGGRTATVAFSFLSSRRHFLELIGTTGTLRVERHVLAPGESTSIEIQTVRGTVTERFAPFDTYQAEVENLGDAIRGEAAPLVDGDEAIRQMRVLDAVRESARSGEWVALH
ncbi:MAG: Gfo/Idh/MocA family oxidoreductase [Chloroflexota bacterium]|nr:Gfo/Idh/MocA family oxidoreductase [Chloroflexota bacterium]MDE2898318.1 Gfo/Idh/MocA family oxidoreductase [Chloroflexota bacterium]